nr:MAG TPA: hypothetical protein [Caudoviricetes sp.]
MKLSLTTYSSSKDYLIFSFFLYYFINVLFSIVKIILSFFIII